MEVTFNIPQEKISRITDAMSGLYEIPMININTEEEPVWGPKYTNMQWAKECIKKWVKFQVARWEQKVARDAITFEIDDSIIN